MKLTVAVAAVPSKKAVIALLLAHCLLLLPLHVFFGPGFVVQVFVLCYSHGILVQFLGLQSSR